MFFTVLPAGTRAPSDAKSKAFLLTDNWDDWFEFSTLYSLVIFDDHGEKHVIGGVKIGQFGMVKDQRRPDLPLTFNGLDDRFFSLGQDDSYYDDLNDLGFETRERVLVGLKDMSLDLDLFDRALSERVTGTSLLRSVSKSTVTGQYHRMALGGARLSRYEFSYTGPPPARARVPALSLEFSVEPEAFPPTNIHVVIGRNGVGKTTVLNNMTRAIVEDDVEEAEVGSFSTGEDDLLGGRPFSNLVSVTFSAFDPFEPLPTRRDKSEGVQYAYIGLKHIGPDKDGKPLPPKTPEALSRDFVSSVLVCRKGARSVRWRRALEMLEADPIFRDAEVAALAAEDLEIEDLKKEARRLFKNFSSGHKIVLLTITRIVETVEEKTLVLLDEPEAHLHPPLLSAFVRALSDLLINRNGVAVIATHSPVVLQEVPSSCVWKVRRTGARAVAERPEIETFGENVGVLTREIFGLEVTHSGFHRMLYEAVQQDPDFDSVVAKFNGELGGEARAIIRALLAAKEENDG
jgi:predicted ATPase